MCVILAGAQFKPSAYSPGPPRLPLKDLIRCAAAKMAGARAATGRFTRLALDRQWFIGLPDTTALQKVFPPSQRNVNAKGVTPLIKLLGIFGTTRRVCFRDAAGVAARYEHSQVIGRNPLLGAGETAL